MEDIYNKCVEAAEYIKTKFDAKDSIGIVLGSGLGELAEEIENPVSINYSDIPNFPVSTVEGHDGKLIFGKLNNTNVLCMKGRFHYYEGYDAQSLTMYVRVMKLLGVKSLILTNAAGGINNTFKPGTLMVIDDFINYMGINPLRGKNIDEFGVRFPDMSKALSPELRDLADECGKEIGIELRHGVYMGFMGPCFETPAEIRFARIVGADAAGMSTVPELIVAKHCSLPVLGISCITNLAAGMTNKELSHEEVQKVANKVKDQFKNLIKLIIERA